jgi:uncharacterized Zn finger protein (UPF0148 family)
MFCEQCGRQVKEGIKYCPYCGAGQKGIPAPAVKTENKPQKGGKNEKQKKQKITLTEEEKKKRGKRRKIAVIVVVLLCALGAGGYFLGIPLYEKITAVPADGQHALSENYRSIILDAGKAEMEDYEQAYYDLVVVELRDEKHGDDGTGTAKAVVTTPDMHLVVADVFAAMQTVELETEEEYNKEFSRVFQEALAAHSETVKTTVEVALEKDGFLWKVVSNAEFEKAVTGDLEQIYLDYYLQAEEAYLNEIGA